MPWNTLQSVPEHIDGLLCRDAWELRGIGLLPGLEVDLSGAKRSRKSELSVDALNTVSGVDVLDQDNLVAGSTTLSGYDGRVGEEVLPDLIDRMSALILAQ